MKHGWEKDGSGVRRHYVNNEIHSINDEPAFLSPDTKAWYKNGLLHREKDLPAIISKVKDSIFTKHWYKDGFKHRDKGPATIWDSGHEEFFLFGEKISKKDFLALPRKKGKIHSEVGPVIINNKERYFLEGREIEKDSFFFEVLIYKTNKKKKKEQTDEFTP